MRKINNIKNAVKFQHNSKAIWINVGREEHLKKRLHAPACLMASGRVFQSRHAAVGGGGGVRWCFRGSEALRYTICVFVGPNMQRQETWCECLNWFIENTAGEDVARRIPLGSMDADQNASGHNWIETTTSQSDESCDACWATVQSREETSVMRIPQRLWTSVNVLNIGSF